MQVIVVTHAYGDCRGVRYLTNGLKARWLQRWGAGHTHVTCSLNMQPCLGCRQARRCLLHCCFLQVYYLHRRPIYQQTSFPTLFGNMCVLRAILLRERISLVHAHQAFSTLALEALLHAGTMGFPVCGM
jgi:phosphatidylinositol glycan class A protein